MKIRRVFTLAAAAAAVSTAAIHAEFRKSYFAATKPGSWAKYAVSYGGPPTMQYTYRRLPDENGVPRIEFAMEYETGEARGKRFIYGYWFKRGFPIEKDALSYGRWISRMTTQQGTGKPQETPSSELAATVATMADYGAIAVYVDSGVVDGRKCDHYSYKWSPPGKPARVESGNLWLNESVPFGVVRSDMATRSPRGETVSTMETKLIAAGTSP